MMIHDPPPAETSYPITAHAVTINVLLYLLDVAERGEAIAPLSGLQPEELAALRNMTVRDLCKVTDQRQPLLRVSIDPNQLRLCVARARMREDVEATKRWFVQRGTPHVLMQELYGTPIREFRSLRDEVGVSSRQGGRPRVMKSDDARRVRERWSQLDSRLPMVDRYRVIGEAFPEDSIASLYGAIHDHRS